MNERGTTSHMSSIALRQAMVPTAFFLAGLSLLTISYLPIVQQHRLPSYPAGALPYASPQAAPADTAASLAPVPPAADTTRAIIDQFAPGNLPRVKITNTIPRGNDVLNSAPRATGKEIHATPSKKILQDNPVTIGRDDPFKSLVIVRKHISLPVPPPFPFPIEPIADAPPMPFAPPSVTPPAPPQPSLAPAPAPQLKVGLSLQGMVGGDPTDTAAILTIDGNTQLVRMGEVIRRPGFILTVVGINERELSVTLSDGKGHFEVLKTE